MGFPTPGTPSVDAFARIRRAFTTAAGCTALALAGIQCGDKGITVEDVPVPTSLQVMAGDNQEGTVGAALPVSLTVRVLDQAAKPMKDRLVRFVVTEGGGVMTSGVPLTNASGDATDQWTLGTAVSDSQRVQVRVEEPGTGTVLLTTIFRAKALADVASQIVKASVDSASVNAGSAVTVAPRIRVMDRFGNPIVGASVTFAASSGGGSVTGATQTTSATGHATVGSWTLGNVAGPNTLTAAMGAPINISVGFFATGNVGAATKVVLTRPAVGATTGTGFDTQPTVEVRDAVNNVRAGDNTTVVTMTVSTGATVVGTATATAVGGVAAFVNVGIIGKADSTYTLTYSAPSLTAATQNIIPTAGVAKVLALTTNAAGAVSGSAFTTQPVVAVRDSLGNLKKFDNTTVVTMTVSAGATVVGTATAPAVNGVATFATVGISGPAATNFTLTFAASGLASATQAITPVAGAPTQLGTVTTAAGAASGAAFTTQPVVSVRDATNNTIPGDNATVVTMTVSAGASIVGTATATAVNGVATFNDVGLSGVSSANYTLTFSAPSLTSVTQGVFLAPGAATELVLAVNAATAASGAAFGTQPVVYVRDAQGNTRTGDSVTVVTMSVSAGASMLGTFTVAASNGVVTFANAGIVGYADSTYTLTFASSGIPSITQPIIVAAGAAAKVVLTTQPAGIASGLAFATQPVVQIQDGFVNLIASDNSTVVTMTVSAGATVVGTATATAVNGVATFADVGISGLADSIYTVTFSAPSLTVATHNVTAAAGAATHLALTTDAAGAPSGSAFTTQPVVAIRDAFGNVVLTDNGTVVTVTTSGDGVIVGTATASTVNGLATFTNVGISGAADSTYVLTFAAGGLTSATQNIAPSPGAAAQLVIVTPAASSPSGDVFTTQPVIAVLDAFGNLRVNDNGTVVDWTVSGGGIRAFSPSTATAVNGHATFTNAGIHGSVDSSYTLTYSSAGLTSATQTVDPTLGAAFSLRFSINAGSGTNGVAFSGQPALVLTDYFGNVHVNDNTTVVTATVSSGASVIGTPTATLVNGIATFVDLGLVGIADSLHTLTYSASAPGVNAISQEVMLTYGVATHLGVVTPAAGAVVGAAFATQPVIAIRDSYGNTVKNDNATQVTMQVFNSGPNLGSPIGTNVVTAVNGIVTFANVGMVGPADTTYTLSFDAAGLSSAAQQIVPTAGAPDNMVLTTLAAGAASGAIFTTQPVIAIRDTAGTVLTSDNSTVVTLTVSAGASIFGTTTATAVNGYATFGNVGISGYADTTYTLSFSAPGLPVYTQDIVVVTGASAAIASYTPAAGAVNGSPFGTLPAVAISDNFGNIAVLDNSTVVTMTVSSGATVVGVATATAVNGLATFAGVGIDGVIGTVYTLHFNAPGLLELTQPIVMLAAAPTNLVITTNALGAPAGAAFINQPVIAVRDASGNTVTGDNTTVVTMTVSAGAATTGTVSVTAVNGIATFADVGIAGLADTTYELTFAAPSLSSATQNVIAGVGAGTQLALQTSAAGSVSGQVFTTQPVVLIQDVAGNTVTTDNTTEVTMTVSGSTTIIGTAAVTAVAGVATFTNVGIHGPAGANLSIFFDAGSLTAAFQNITPTRGAATRLVAITDAAGPGSGAPFATQPIVWIADEWGNIDTDDNVTVVTLTVDGGGAITGGNQATAVNGIATFVNAGLDGQAGNNFTLTYAANGTSLTPALRNIVQQLGAANDLAIVTPAAGVSSGLAFLTQPVIHIKDVGDNTITTDNSTVVTIAVSSGAGIIGTATATAVNGVATFTDVGINGVLGTTYTLTYTASGLNPDAHDVTVTIIPTQLAITTFAGGGSSGSAFTQQPVIEVRDASGNLATTDNTTVVTATVSAGPTVIGTATATAVAGVATFVDVGISGQAIFSHTLTFSAPGLTDATQSIVVGPGAATHLTLVTQAAGAPAGAAFTTQPVIYIRDAAGNLITSDNSTLVYMAVRDFAADPNGTATATAANGIATFTNVGINGVAGTTYTLDFAVSGTPLTIATQTVVGAAGAATKLLVVTPAGGAVDGQFYLQQPVIAIADIAGNTVVSDNSTVVQVNVSAGASIVVATNATAVNGLATFQNSGVDGLIDSVYTLTYTAPSLTSTDQTVTVTTGPATQLVLDTFANGAPAGAAFNTQPVVSIRDALNNTVTSANGEVITMTVSDGIGIVGTATATIANGVATFADVGINGLAGSNYTLTFSTPALTDATQLVLASVGSATHLVIVTLADGGAPGAQLGTQPVIAIRDAGDNTVGDDNSSIVTMTINGGAAVTGSNTATASGGVATFAGAGIDGAVGPSFTVTYTVNGSSLTVATQPLVLGFGAAAQLELVTAAIGGVVNGAFGTQPVVHVQDVGDNTITTDNSTIVTMIVSAGATVVGTASATAVNGVATFTDIGVSGTPGVSYTLTFEAPGLASATQNFTVGSGPPALLGLSVAATGAASGEPFTGQPVIEIRDVSNNVVTGDNSSVVTATVSSGATLVGTVTATAVNGVATFANLGVSGVAGTQYDLTFQSGSLTLISQGITPTFGAPSQLVIVTPAAGAASGAQFATQPVIAIKDAAGNTITNDYSTGITMTVDGGAAVTGTAINMAVAGMSVFQNAGLDGAVGPTFNITYSVVGSSITSATQQIVLGFGAPGQLELVTPAAGIPINGAFGVQPVVHVQDIGDNTITTDNATVVTMTVNNGASVVGLDNATAVNGVATFNNVGISGVAGTTYTLTFSSGALQAATQDVTPVDLEGITADAGQHWFNTTGSANSAGLHSVQARAYTSSWNNFNLRFYSTMYYAGGDSLVATDTNTTADNWTRNGAAYRNDATPAGRLSIEWLWSGGTSSGVTSGGYYGTLQRANAVLKAIRIENTLINGNTADTKRAEVWALLMQGSALSGLALNYDKGFYIDENTSAYDPNTFAPLNYVSRKELRDSAVSRLNAVVALAVSNSFSTPAAWAGNRSYSNSEVAQVARTMIALTLANYARDAAEADQVDWAAVATAASNGITSDFKMVGDGCIKFCPEMLLIFNEFGTWARVSTRISRLLAPSSQIDPWPLGLGGNAQPSSADKRLGDGSFGDVTLAGTHGTIPTTVNAGTDFVWSPYTAFQAARGYWHQSNIGHIRYDASGQQGGGGIVGGYGDAPMLTVALKDLLLAEAYLRLGNAGSAVALINQTRVTRGNLPAATIGAGLGSTSDGPCTSAGTLTIDLTTSCTVWSMLLYEKEIELLGVGSQSYYEQRRLPVLTAPDLHIQGLIVGTPREMPVPHNVLIGRGDALYTWGGTGQPNSPTPP
jgi:hypothetical protein